MSKREHTAHQRRMELLAYRIQVTRERRGLQPKEVALALGVDRNVVTRWERGSGITLRHLFELAAFFRVKPAWLVGGIT